MKYLYAILAILLLITSLFFPQIITVTSDERLNGFLGLLLALHFINSAKLEEKQNEVYYDN